MNANRLFLESLCAGFLIFSACGCSKQAGGIEPTAVVTAKVDSSFANADAGATTLAKDGVAALKNNDLATAYQQFKSLSERQDLTREQRLAASAAFVNVLQQARMAADKGDAQAQALLKSYTMTK